MNAKSWYTSRTILLALAQAAAGLVVAFLTDYPEVGWLAVAKSVLDMAVRWVTTAPLR